MTLDNVQAYFAGLITADAQLGLLGTPIQFDPYKDPEEAKSAIADQLRATGVCIEIEEAELYNAETLLDGTTKGDAHCSVLVAESVLKAHTPNRSALRTRIIQTCTKRPSGTQKPARYVPGEGAVRTEGGYVLRMYSFFIPLNIKPA
jgi:hypothetical protein